MDKTELRRIAAAHGLNRLTDRHLEQFAESLRNNAALAKRLPKDLHWSDESALVFRLPVPKEPLR